MKKTIKTFLLSENPRGVKQLWDEMGQIRCTYFTSAELAEARKIKELSQPALYMLTGDAEEIYIGVTDNFKNTFENAIRPRILYNRAFVFTLLPGPCTIVGSEFQYLKAVALEKVKQVGNYTVNQNKQSFTKPTLAEHRKEIINEYFDQICFLSDFLGYDMFKSYAVQTTKNSKQDIWVLESKGIFAKAIYKGNKMTLLKGSTVVKDPTPSYKKYKKVNQDRKRKLRKSAMEQNDFYTLTESIEFKSPTGAAEFCLGSWSNGREVWKNKDGKSINEVVM